MSLFVSVLFIFTVFMSLYLVAMFFSRKRELGRTEFSDKENYLMLNVHFNMIVLMFSVLSSALFFVLPWLVNITAAGLFSFLFFITVLILALLYALKKGALKW